MPLAKDVQAHAIDLVLSTHLGDRHASPLAKKYVRYHVSRADIDKAAPDALRHRIILNFEGEAEGTTTEEVIAKILELNAG